MTRYGIADIGSNTIVLLVYEMDEGKPISIYHKSTPSHLIDDVSQDRMYSKGTREKAIKAGQQSVGLIVGAIMWILLHIIAVKIGIEPKLFEK